MNNETLDAKTVAQLIDLNNRFYKQIADSFSNTRSYSWSGWNDLVSYFKQLSFTPRSFLDLGCGNGRFISFIKNNWELSAYLGIDSSKELLTHAHDTYKNVNKAKFIVHDLLANCDLNLLADTKYDLVTILGVMHHVPGSKLRTEVLKEAAKHLKQNGFLVVTFWDFLSEKQLSKKIVPWDLVDIDASKLNEHDYLLDWKRDKLAYRYCHYYTESEIEDIAKQAGLKIVKQFLADGPGGKANRYVVFQSAA